MDLIYTDVDKSDLGVLTAYAFDLSFGEKENDFELTLGLDEPKLDFGAFVYIEGTEYGGIIDAKQSRTGEEYIKYMGRTWHGMLNSKIIKPDAGAAYLTVSGDAHDVLAQLINRLGLSALYTTPSTASGITISNYQFPRYCAAYDAIRDMLSSVGAKLKITWVDRCVVLSAEPVIDYTDSPVDDDMAVLTVELHKNTVNHLVCLGRGELEAREIIHLYVDDNGNIGDTQFYFDLDEVEDVYDFNSAESLEQLRSNGVEKLRELRDTDYTDMDLTEGAGVTYDIGDLVGATDIQTNNSASAPVTQKIVKINNGAVSIEYQAKG